MFVVLIIIESVCVCVVCSSYLHLLLWMQRSGHWSLRWSALWRSSLAVRRPPRRHLAADPTDPRQSTTQVIDEWGEHSSRRNQKRFLRHRTSTRVNNNDSMRPHLASSLDGNATNMALKGLPSEESSLVESEHLIVSFRFVSFRSNKEKLPLKRIHFSIASYWNS